MGMPVKLSDELVSVARKEAKAADRSITAQIEHWATLGRSLEAAVRHEDLLALKRAAGDLEQAFPDRSVREAIATMLRRVAASTARSRLTQTLTRRRVVYQRDPKGSGLIMRIDANGKRTLGRLRNRQFVPERARRRSAR